MPSCWRPCLPLQLRRPCGGDAKGTSGCCCLCHRCQAWDCPRIVRRLGSWRQPLPLCTSCLWQAAAPGTLAAGSRKGWRWGLLLLVAPFAPLLPLWHGSLAELRRRLVRVAQDALLSIAGGHRPVSTVRPPCCPRRLHRPYEHLVCWLCGRGRVCIVVHRLRLLTRLSVLLAICCLGCGRRMGLLCGSWFVRGAELT
jgi:hypothetical protein